MRPTSVTHRIDEIVDLIDDCLADFELARLRYTRPLFLLPGGRGETP